MSLFDKIIDTSAKIYNLYNNYSTAQYAYTSSIIDIEGFIKLNKAELLKSTSDIREYIIDYIIHHKDINAIDIASITLITASDEVFDTIAELLPTYCTERDDWFKLLTCVMFAGRINRCKYLFDSCPFDLSKPTTVTPICIDPINGSILPWVQVCNPQIPKNINFLHIYTTSDGNEFTYKFSWINGEVKAIKYRSQNSKELYLFN